jgi:glycosyltransferase involved in cell wall biosynthesis
MPAENLAPMHKPGLVLIGPVPPPPFGCSNLNQSILERAADSAFRIIHIDITDRRVEFNYGRLDVINVYLALKHLAQLLWTLATEQVSIVYLTVATVPLAYLRDGLFIEIASWFRKRIVVHSHGRENRLFYDRSGPLLKWFIRRTLRKATLAACEGEIVRGIVFDGLIPLERVLAVPNGVADPYGAVARFGDRRNATPLQVTYVAHMWEPKGYREILHVAPEVVAAFPTVHFNFAGRWANPAEAAAAMQLVAELGIERYVSFLGQIDDAARSDLLLRSDVFAFPTKFWTEGQPLSVIDAMAAGLPVIASNVGCIPENLVHGQCGFLIEAGDRIALRDRLLELLRDPELRARMGAASRQRYLANYRDDRFVAGIETLFKRALEA